MPPKLSAALAELPIERLGRRLELFQRTLKKLPRLVVYVYDGTHRESIIWLSEKPEERLQEILMGRPDFSPDDITEEFVSSLLAGTPKISIPKRASMQTLTS